MFQRLLFSRVMLAVSLFLEGKEIKPHRTVLSSGCKLGQWVREVWGSAGRQQKGELVHYPLSPW